MRIILLLDSCNESITLDFSCIQNNKIFAWNIIYSNFPMTLSRSVFVQGRTVWSGSKMGGWMWSELCMYRCHARTLPVYRQVSIAIMVDLMVGLERGWMDVWWFVFIESSYSVEVICLSWTMNIFLVIESFCHYVNMIIILHTYFMYFVICKTMLMNCLGLIDKFLGKSNL